MTSTMSVEQNFILIVSFVIVFTVSHAQSPSSSVFPSTSIASVESVTPSSLTTPSITGQTVTAAPSVSPSASTSSSPVPSVESTLVNPVDSPVVIGTLEVHIRFFAQIPDYNGDSSWLVGMTPHNGNLFVTTSTSGGLIYEVSMAGDVSLFFDVASAMVQSTGRALNVENTVHGGVRAVAFHPTFAETGLFYVSVMEARPTDESTVRYFSKPDDTSSSRADADSVVIEWRFDLASSTVDPLSYRQVIRIGMPVLDHPIKQMIFVGGDLFIGHGDGSFQSATTGGGQANDGLGKIIRINPLKSGTEPYSIPPSNPFIGRTDYMDELYAVGFRNPHNLCYSSVRSQLYVTDAGRDNVEEVNLVRAGGNYGWSLREGPFVHLKEGGTVTGVDALPDDDAEFGFIYPNAVVGHTSVLGDKFNGQALAGSCPVENESSLQNIMMYANFPTTGTLYYSYLNELDAAVVTGTPPGLRQATTFRPKIFFDHDNNPGTASIEVENLREIIRIDSNSLTLSRVDLRFGQGPRGEIYISSKQNGKIYLITSTVS